MSSFTRVALLVVLWFPSSASGQQPPPGVPEVGLTGRIVAPDGTPVSAGTVAVSGAGVGSASAAIDRNGEFRLVPGTTGVHRLQVSAPGFALYRVDITLPPSRRLTLPPITVLPATYFRARVLTPAGELATSARLHHLSVDIYGVPSPASRDEPVRQEIDRDGTVTLGPLPLGITTLVLDAPPFALMRLPDVHVNGAAPLLDGGTVTLQPGATLLVDVVDASGAPLPNHDVLLEDVRPFSPVRPVSVPTDAQGRATFDRLAAGNYRLATGVAGRRGEQRLFGFERVIAIGGSGTLQTRLVAGGTAMFRLTSTLAPTRGVRVSASASTPPPAPPAWLRDRNGRPPTIPPNRVILAPGCFAGTDADGRVSLTSFPPGPASVTVQLVNSTYVRRVNVPSEPRELPIAIPDGILPLRILDAVKKAPIAAAGITWTGGEARVTATASATGEALLEGVAPAPGVLEITAQGFERREVRLSEPSSVLHEVSLMPLPPTTVQLRVLTASGDPIAGAVVHLAPENVMHIGHIAATDAKGVVSVTSVAPGAFRLTAHADGFVAVTKRIADDDRNDIALVLSPPR